MIYLVQDLAWFSLIFRALLLAAQTLLVGAALFLAFVRPEQQIPAVTPRILRWITRFGWAMCAIALANIAADSFVLMLSVGLPFTALLTAEYFLAGCVSAVLGVALALAASRFGSKQHWLLPVLAACLLLSNVFTSHAVARLDHQLFLAAMTLLHQAAAALWIGGLAFLLLTLRTPAEPEQHRRVLQRYTPLAVIGVVTVLLSGIALSWFYTASPSALYGTAYGVMIIAKAVMLGLLVLIGALNFRVGRVASFGNVAVTLLRRFSEFELLGAFAVLLLASSLTSQPPGVDLVQDRLTPHELTSHFKPRWPVLSHPPLEQLAPATSAEEAALHPDDLERAAAHTNRDPDLAWSEFEHNWSGIFLIALGALGVLANFRSFRWARFWPLIFLPLAVFLMVFSDPENWPLGPVSYWTSFSDPEVLLHRVSFCFLILFGIFETGVQLGRYGRRAAMIFPALTFLGGAGLLLHTHALGNVKLELFAEISHIPIAVLGMASGVFRLTALWLTEDRRNLLQDHNLPWLDRAVRICCIASPACLFLLGLILFNYREG